jgi:hypothetical protein
MKSIPVDDRRMQLLLAVPPRLQSKPNPFTGEVEWNVDLFVVADDRADVLQVAVPESGLAKNLSPGGTVEVAGLTAIAWEKQGNHGLMFRCENVRPVGAASAGSSKQAAA